MNSIYAIGTSKVYGGNIYFNDLVHFAGDVDIADGFYQYGEEKRYVCKCSSTLVEWSTRSPIDFLPVKFSIEYRHQYSLNPDPAEGYNNYRFSVWAYSSEGTKVEVAYMSTYSYQNKDLKWDIRPSVTTGIISFNVETDMVELDHSNKISGSPNTHFIYFSKTESGGKTVYKPIISSTTSGYTVFHTFKHIDHIGYNMLNGLNKYYINNMEAALQAEDKEIKETAEKALNLAQSTSGQMSSIFVSR